MTSARARATDPDTSHAAASSLPEDDLRRAQAEVLAFFRRRGPMTDTLLVNTYRGPVVQSPSGLRTRRSELVKRGLIVDSGARVTLPSGRNAILWATPDQLE